MKNEPNKDYNRTSFEKQFRKQIPNFNELICHFEFKRKSYEPCKIKFVYNNKLYSLEVYKSQYYIDLWKNHFIEFFETGIFDYNGYWIIYGDNQKPVETKIYKIPLCSQYGNDCYGHSPELQKIWKTKNGVKIGKQYGLKQIPKPDDLTNVITL